MTRTQTDDLTTMDGGQGVGLLIYCRDVAYDRMALAFHYYAPTLWKGDLMLEQTPSFSCLRTSLCSCCFAERRALHLPTPFLHDDFDSYFNLLQLDKVDCIRTSILFGDLYQ